MSAFWGAFSDEERPAGQVPQVFVNGGEDGAAEQAGPPALPQPVRVEEIDHPAKLLRIAAMVRALLQEVRQVELDEAGRQRLAGIHDRAIEALREALGDDLREELEEISPPLGDGSPSEGELRVAQAALMGWLEGLFHGIQATIATQQMSAQRQLERMRAARPGPGGPNPLEQGATGQYL